MFKHDTLNNNSKNNGQPCTRGRDRRGRSQREEDAEVPHQAPSNSGSGLAQDHLTQVENKKEQEKSEKRRNLFEVEERRQRGGKNKMGDKVMKKEK